jgi:tetratricopeptide (TPR) repeat protein
MKLSLEETLNKSIETADAGHIKANTGKLETSNSSKPNILDTFKLDKALRLAKRKLKDGQLEEAKSIYEDILKKFSKHKQALIALKSLTGGVPVILQDPPSDQLQPIINHYTQGQLKLALSHATEMLAKFPNSLTLYDLYGASNLGLMQYDAAIACYKQVIRIKPDYAEAYNNMGNALMNKGDLDAAIVNYKQALTIKPDYADAYNNMGNALNSKGDLEAAIGSYQQALKIKPDCAEAYYNMGNVLHDKGDLEAAIGSYQQALKIKPDYAEAYSNMGNVLQDKGDSEAAINSHKRAIKIKPDYAEAYSNIGNALMDQGNLDAAIGNYKQALKTNPDLAEAYYNMGIALSEKGDLDVALDNYNQALKINPEYAEVYNNKGIALQDKGDIKAAIESYEQALKIKSDYAEVHYNHGLLLFADNQYGKAVEHFKFSDFGKSKYYLLRCLYLQDKKSLFYDQLDYLINQDEIHPIIGSLGCRAELRYGIEKLNLFCKDPLSYVLKNDLSNQYDFDKIFVKTARTILNENRIPIKQQRLLTNGNQTSGDLFSLQHDLTEDIQKIIRLEIEKYKVGFKHSTEGLITSWPTDYSLKGWLVSMKSGGKLQPHMHESGWISGSIYIHVPPKSKADSGNLVVCIEEDRLSGKNINQEKIIDVVTGSLCLFPASLLHYTIPFESEEDRIVLAFDVVPKW